MSRNWNSELFASPGRIGDKLTGGARQADAYLIVIGIDDCWSEKALVKSRKQNRFLDIFVLD